MSHVTERIPRVELVPDRLYVLGDSVTTDGRVSWAPEAHDVYQPQNCFVLTDGDASLVVDPGPAIVQASVLAGLDAIPASDVAPIIFLTRYQLDGIGNLGPVAERLSPSAVYSGGVINPFDSFDQVGAAQGGDLALTFSRISPGEPVIYGDSTFEVLAPMLRLLATYWGYDRTTGTLFTSDSFTHAVVTDRADRPVVDAPELDRSTVDDVRAHVVATFEWLQGANTAPIIEWLQKLFDERDVRTIAPDRGCVLNGAEIVNRHLDLMIAALRDLGQGA
jgi:hypothetical protein